jgi:hypothetical protein
LNALGIALKEHPFERYLKKLPLAKSQQEQRKVSEFEKEHSRLFEQYAYGLQKRLEFALLDDPNILFRARAAFSSFVKAYATHSKAFKVSSRQEERRKGSLQVKEPHFYFPGKIRRSNR